MALHCNASESFASSTAFATDSWPTVAGCFEPRWPHDPQVPARLSVSPSESDIFARLPISLQQHRGPFWCGEFPRLQR